MQALSTRELEILALYDSGLGYKEIGAQLGISEHTVRTYAQRVMFKTAGARSLRHAAWLRRTSAPDDPKTPGKGERLNAE